MKSHVLMFIGLIFLNELIVSQCQNEQLISKQLLFKDKKLYRVTPISQIHLDFLTNLRSSNFGILFWNGIGGIGEAVDLLSTPSLINSVRFECLYLGLLIDQVFSTVSIKMTNEKDIQRSVTPKECAFDISASNADENTKTFSVDVAPITKIDLTDLYTGLFYKVSMKRFPNGWMSFTAERNDDGDNYLQIDLDPSHLPHYDQCLTLDDQWSFGQTEVPGWYNLTNRGIPNGLVTWSQQIIGSGNALVISSDSNNAARLSEFGDSRNDSLWTPIQSDDDGYYKLALKGLLDATITWTYEKYGDYSHYLIAATKLEDRILYQPGNKWYDDLLFKFELASDVTLDATISEFEFNVLPKQLIEEMNESGIKFKRIDMIYIPNRSSASESVEIDETMTSWNNTFAYQFDQDIQGLIPKVKIHLNVEDEKLECGDFVLEAGINGEYKKSMQQIIKVQRKLNVPKFTECHAYVEMQWAEGLQMPFTAKMSITGTTERVINDYDVSNSKVAVGSVPAGVIKEHLKSQGKNWKILNQVGEALEVQVSGILTRSFLIGTTVSPLMIQIHP